MSGVQKTLGEKKKIREHSKEKSNNNKFTWFGE